MKNLRQMDQREEEALLEKIKNILKGSVPLDADFFLILADNVDRRKRIFISNVGHDEAVEWLDDCAEFIYMQMKKEAKRKRRDRL